MFATTITPARATRVVHIPSSGASLVAELTRPVSPRGLVIFVEGRAATGHASDQGLARKLQDSGFSTLRLDLLTPDEELLDGKATDIALLSRRLIETIDWAAEQHSLAALPVGLFTTGTASAAAVVASVVERSRVSAIVSSNGRLELASSVRPRLTTPLLQLAAGDEIERRALAWFEQHLDTTELAPVESFRSARALYQVRCATAGMTFAPDVRP